MFGEIETNIGYAIRSLNEAYDRLAKAADCASGLPLENKLDSVLYDLENLQNDIEKYQREVRSA